MCQSPFMNFWGSSITVCKEYQSIVFRMLFHTVSFAKLTKREPKIGSKMNFRVYFWAKRYKLLIYSAFAVSKGVAAPCAPHPYPLAAGATSPGFPRG